MNVLMNVFVMNGSEFETFDTFGDPEFIFNFKLSSQTNIKAGTNLPETRQLIGINMTLFIC